MGTNDTGATPTDPDGSGGSNNMVQVSANEFDGGVAGKDGNLTKTTLFQDGTAANNGVTDFGYDFRDRLTSVDGELNFFEEYTYDNLNRVIVTKRKNDNGGGTLLAQSETKLDNLGRPYQRIVYKVEGSPPYANLKEKFWYSPTGQVIKTVPFGTRLFVKAQYDGLGRMTMGFQCFDTAEADTDYEAAESVENNTRQP